MSDLSPVTYPIVDLFTGPGSVGEGLVLFPFYMESIVNRLDTQIGQLLDFNLYFQAVLTSLDNINTKMQSLVDLATVAGQKDDALIDVQTQALDKLEGIFQYTASTVSELFTIQTQLDNTLEVSVTGPVTVTNSIFDPLYVVGP